MLITLLSAVVLAVHPVEPETDLRSLSTDAVIEGLPPAGTEWRFDPAVGEGFEHLYSLEMRRRVVQGGLTDEQWRTALLRTGAIRARATWPKDEPYAVSMTVPRWLDVSQVRLVPQMSGWRNAEAGEVFSGPSGTVAMVRARDAKYQSLGKLPNRRSKIVFHVAVERGQSWFSRDSDPAPGMLWEGQFSLAVEPVDTVEQAIPAADSPALDKAVAASIGAGVRNWHINGRETPTFYVNIDPDTVAHPALGATGLSLEVDVLRNGNGVETVKLVAAALDPLLTSNSVGNGPQRFYASANLKGIPVDIAGDDASLREWTLRVRGTANHLLYLWDAQTHWRGEVTIPLGVAIGQERERTGPKGRGPEVSTPFFR